MERLPNLIASLYADGVNQSSWNNFADQASTFFNADACMLSFCELQSTQDPVMYSFGSLDSNVIGDFTNNIPESRFYEIVKNTPVGEIFNNNNFDPILENNNQQTTDSLPNLVNKVLGGTVYRDEKYEAVISFVRSNDKPDFNELDKSLLIQFFPFLKQAITGYFESHLKPMHNDAEVILESLSYPVALVTKKGNVVATNSYFEQMKQQKSLFYLYSKQLHFYESEAQLWFAEITNRKVSAKLRKNRTTNKNIYRLDMSEQNITLKLSYLRKPITFLTDNDNIGEFMLTIYSPDVEGRALLYRNLFDFTRAEAEVAEQLSYGFTMAYLADRKGVSKHTLRTQLKSIFQKTNTHSQNELVILLNNVV